MKAYLLAVSAFFLASPLAAFERDELDLDGGKYNPQTGLTAYQVENGPCFQTYAEHKAYVDEKGLVYEGQIRVDPIRVVIVFRNEDGTYREVYLVTAGVGGCLMAVGYDEGQPA